MKRGIWAIEVGVLSNRSLCVPLIPFIVGENGGSPPEISRASVCPSRPSNTVICVDCSWFALDVMVMRLCSIASVRWGNHIETLKKWRFALRQTDLKSKGSKNASNGESNAKMAARRYFHRRDLPRQQLYLSPCPPVQISVILCWHPPHTLFHGRKTLKWQFACQTSESRSFSTVCLKSRSSFCNHRVTLLLINRKLAGCYFLPNWYENLKFNVTIALCCVRCNETRWTISETEEWNLS